MTRTVVLLMWCLSWIAPRSRRVHPTGDDVGGRAVVADAVKICGAFCLGRLALDALDP